MGRTALNVAGAANTAVIVAATEKDLDKDLYYGRKEFEDEDASEDEDAVAAAQPEAKAPVEAPAAGKPSGLGAVKGASSANLLNFSPASGGWRAPVRNNAASSFQKEGLILRLQGTLPGPSPWFSP